MELLKVESSEKEKQDVDSLREEMSKRSLAEDELGEVKREMEVLEERCALSFSSLSFHSHFSTLATATPCYVQVRRVSATARSPTSHRFRPHLATRDG
jgi:hypothetical protein